MIARAVKLFQACARVSQAKAFTDRGPDETLAIVLDEHGQLSVCARRNNFDAAALGPRGNPMADGVLHQGLQKEAGRAGVTHVVGYCQTHRQAVTEALTTATPDSYKERFPYPNGLTAEILYFRYGDGSRSVESDPRRRRR